MAVAPAGLGPVKSRRHYVYVYLRVYTRAVTVSNARNVTYVREKKNKTTRVRWKMGKVFKAGRDV